MLRARELAASDWKPTAIQGILEQEGHGRPSTSTIRRWFDAEYASRCNEQQIRFSQARRARNARYRLRGQSEQYRVTFMRTLRVEGVSYRSIGAVCGVVFGEALSEWQVRQAFGGHDPKVTNIGRDANAHGDAGAEASAA